MDQVLFQDRELAALVFFGVSIMLLLSLAFVLFASFSQRRILKEKMNAQALEIEYREELLRSTILTQEEERRRIAKDLHDDLGSKLNVLKLNFHQFKKFTNNSPDALDLVGEVKGLLDRTINTTRRISHELLPPTLQDFGLPTALEELCDGFHRTGTIDIELDVENPDARLPEINSELQLFRVVQELINNSIRHGAARHIGVQLRQDPGQWALDYQDDGKGFDVQKIEEKKGLGLKNIDSRLHMIGATIRYESAPGEGVKAFVELNQVS